MVTVAKIKNNIEFHEGYAVIVGGGKYGGRFIIDIEDAERVLQHKWNKSTLGDVQSRINGKIVRLHTFVTGAGQFDKVRRISGERDDYRKACFRVLKAVE